MTYVKNGVIIMSRPCKKKQICSEPIYSSFAPISSESFDESVCMTVDEYETIRLIDYEGITQEQCAKQMNVARTTVQLIYSKARQKLAECIVKGKQLRIEGGDYRMCEGNCAGFGCHDCSKH